MIYNSDILSVNFVRHLVDPPRQSPLTDNTSICRVYRRVPVAARSKTWVCGRSPAETGFESRRGHGCLSVVSVVCCQVEVSATGWSLVQRSPTDCGASLSVIYKLVNEESMAQWGLPRQIKKKWVYLFECFLPESGSRAGFRNAVELRKSDQTKSRGGGSLSLCPLRFLHRRRIPVMSP